MNPTNTLLVTALEIADPDAQIRKEVIELIREIVKQELALFTNTSSITLGALIVNEQTYTIKQIALAALKEHFNNPQHIPPR